MPMKYNIFPFGTIKSSSFILRNTRLHPQGRQQNRKALSSKVNLLHATKQHKMQSTKMQTHEERAYLHKSLRGHVEGNTGQNRNC